MIERRQPKYKKYFNCKSNARRIASEAAVALIFQNSMEY